jgi:hypothetical protein
MFINGGFTCRLCSTSTECSVQMSGLTIVMIAAITRAMQVGRKAMFGLPH